MSGEADRDDALREMARHRGFKLLKSRRRRPGVGVFGRFGLSDVSGKPVMGIGPDGLTVLPEEIEVFLRAGALVEMKMLSQLNTVPRLRWRTGYIIARSQRYFDAELHTIQEDDIWPVSF